MDDIRLIVRTIHPSNNGQLAARSEGCRTMVSFPGEVEAIPQRHQGTIEMILTSLRAVLDSERRTEGEELLNELAECLRLTCGRQKRKGGGWQYIDSFMLDSVLFADNLRPLYDGDLMRDSVKQNLWYVFIQFGLKHFAFNFVNIGFSYIFVWHGLIYLRSCSVKALA